MMKISHVKMLPFKYEVVPRQENVLQLINKAFEYSFSQEDFEISTKKLHKKDRDFYNSTDGAGFTVFSSEKELPILIFHLDLDGSADGEGEKFKLFTHQFLILKNHPKACIKFSGSVTVSSFLAKDESILARFDIEPFKEKLFGLLNPVHCDLDAISKYSEIFYEKSIFTLENVFTVPINLERWEYWPRSGPADYRSFKYSFNDIGCMENPEFIVWLSAITGLPLLQPALPIYTRCLEAAGDYQILHGNHSEPYGLDVISSFYLTENYREWPESACGRIHYLNDTGDEIFHVNPLNNSITIVYRTEGCTRFTENVKGIPEIPLFQTIATYTVAAEVDSAKETS